jgi:hypothetical protein
MYLCRVREFQRRGYGPREQKIEARLNTRFCFFVFV